MSDLQSRLACIEDDIKDIANKEIHRCPYSEKERLGKLENAVADLTAILRKHLETGER